MSVPKYDELMKPLLLAVQDGSIYKIKDVTTTLAQQFKLTEEDIAMMLPSGRQTVFKNRVGWAKTYLKKAGLLDSPARATIIITEAGKKVVAENPEKIDAKYLERFPSFAEFQSTSVSTEDGGGNPAAKTSKDLTPDDQLEDAYKEINDSLASDLLTEVLKIPPYTFEKFVVDLLLKMGYGKADFGSHATVASSGQFGYRTAGAVQQALRAYEGFLKKLLRDQDIELTENELLGDVFGHRKADNTFYMHTESAAKVNDPNKERVLTAMYQFYYQHRHPYSHASADDFDTVIIEDRKVADELFNEVIQSMKAGFTELQ